jgi:hypothetical protein
MPAIELEKARLKRLSQCWELAEFFCVDQNLVKLRLDAYSQREKQEA